MSAINYLILDRLANKLEYEYYDIAEQVYNNKPETVLIRYADEDHTTEIEKHVIYDNEEGVTLYHE